MNTSNPALNKKAYGLRAKGKEVMTINGTIFKTIVLLSLLLISATWTWINADLFIDSIILYLIIGTIAALGLAILTIVKPNLSPFTTPIYALIQGFYIGWISLWAETMYPGIVIDAVMITFAILFVMLLSYSLGIIKMNAKVKAGIVIATLSVFLIYFVSFILGLFGISLPIFGNGAIGIGFSVLVIIIAAMNFLLDFDFIENASKKGLPKFMEWFGAFSLLVTLIWLYIEVLNLLMKLRSRE